MSSEMKYSENQVWVLETRHGYYPLGTWGFAAYLGKDEAEARAKLKYWQAKTPGEYRLYNNQTSEVIDEPAAPHTVKDKGEKRDER